MEADKPLRRRRRWIIALSAIVGLAIIQSVTFTPAVEVRYVDAATESPIEGLTVTAVWHLYAATPGGSLESGALRVQEVKTDATGRAYVPTAVMFHAPVFPFGVQVRQVRALPVLFSSDDRYEPSIESAGIADASLSILAFQKTAMDETTVKLETTPRSAAEILDIESARQYARRSVDQALFSCRRSRFCRSVGVAL